MSIHDFFRNVQILLIQNNRDIYQHRELTDRIPQGAFSHLFSLSRNVVEGVVGGERLRGSAPELALRQD